MPNDKQRPDKSERPQQAKKGQVGNQGNQGNQAQEQEMGQDMRQGQGQRHHQRQAQQGGELDGTERARDEQRQGGGPRYGGGPWNVADERGDQRFGHARNDDADPAELTRGSGDNDDDELPSAADPELAQAEANGEIESGGQRSGFGRGEQPRKPKSRES